MLGSQQYDSGTRYQVIDTLRHIAWCSAQNIWRMYTVLAANVDTYSPPFGEQGGHCLMISQSNCCASSTRRYAERERYSGRAWYERGPLTGLVDVGLAVACSLRPVAMWSTEVVQ